jgi:glucuronosyltransferase
MTIPSNVRVSNWLPQDELLAHPRVLLFITHAGYNGLMESINYAKPMIVFPLFGDQHYNARCMEYKGYARRMSIHDFTADELVENIIQVITDPEYTRKVTRASEIFKADAQAPLEKTIWWIEHVIRFGGDHLRSGGNDLAWYQYWMLDVLLAFTVILFIVLTCIFSTCRFIFRKCCRASSTKVKQN